MKRLLFAMVSCALFFGCQTADEAGDTQPAPDWVTGEPGIEGMICAVGMSGPTYYKDEAREYALESARAELARTLSVNIETIMVDISSDKGNRIDEATVMQVSSWVSSVVLENSEPKGYWYDTEGWISGRKDVTFALVCMPRKFDRENLEISLQNTELYRNHPLEEIKRDAGDIIKKLEEER